MLVLLIQSQTLSSHVDRNMKGRKDVMHEEVEDKTPNLSKTTCNSYSNCKITNIVGEILKIGDL